MKLRILASFCMVLTLGVTALAAQAPSELPRKETLYFNGWQWGPPPNFNPISPNGAFPVNYGNIFEFTYETLFMYNMLTNQAEPLVGTKYSWVDKYTLKVELNKAAKFSDGQSLTAEDVAYSYLLGKKYAGVPWGAYLAFIADVVPQSPTVVLIKCDKDNFNPLYVTDSITRVYMMPKHVWAPIEEKTGNKFEELLKVFNENPIGSGPYKVSYYDDTRIVCTRDDNYWGKALYGGKLPAPKYLAHIIYKSNDAGTNAFRNGEVDVSQQFINQVWNLWKNKEPFKTYLAKLPYYMPALTPYIVFRQGKPGLDDKTVRRALAMAIDYKKIAEVAMSGYSDPIIPGIILQTPAEKKFIDESAVKGLYYKTDVDAANKLLDTISAKGSDGVRVLKDGTRLGPWEISCPYGWTDWNASLEIVSQSAKKIGIELRTKFPEFPSWLNDFNTGNFDIAMWNSMPPSMAEPWDRTRDFMFSEGNAAIGQIATWNRGRYSNPRADELIKAIPSETDQAKLKAMYTELDKIFISDLPGIQLMYRPATFYTVNEKVWKGLPDEKNNKANVPPTCGQAAFIKALWNISAK
jgi:peptide/nickel transport system substrate-binding protein